MPQVAKRGGGGAWDDLRDALDWFHEHDANCELRLLASLGLFFRAVRLRRQIVLIDPLVPPEGAHRFDRALGRDVARASAVRVLLTVHHHARSAEELTQRYSAFLVTALSQGLPRGIERFPTASARRSRRP